MPESYPMGSGIMPDQDNSACNSLKNVIAGVGSCTGLDSCNSKTPVVTTKLCKSCTYDSYTWGYDEGRCGCKKDGPKCCNRGHKTRLCNIYRCYWSYSWGCEERDECGAECKIVRGCPNGLKTTLTGINCDKCGTYYSTTGGDCVGATVTRNAPRTCKSNREFDDLKSLCYPKCNDGYVKKPGDVVSCWNKDSIIKPITDTVIPLLTNSTFQYS
jgi:hypothetical protein